jgi:hypothetical protein
MPPDSRKATHFNNLLFPALGHDNWVLLKRADK